MHSSAHHFSAYPNWWISFISASNWALGSEKESSDIGHLCFLQHFQQWSIGAGQLRLLGLVSQMSRTVVVMSSERDLTIHSFFVCPAFLLWPPLLLLYYL